MFLEPNQTVCNATLLNCLPSSSEITGKSSNQKCLDIPISLIPTSSIPSSVEPAISAISSAVIDATNTAANTAANTASEIAAMALGLLSELLSAFDNFKPRSPTANFVGQITDPDIYLATISTSFLTVAAILLLMCELTFQPLPPQQDLNNTINNKQSKLSDKRITNNLWDLNKVESTCSQPDLISQLPMLDLSKTQLPLPTQLN
ncbi:hypothetical protein F8M41_018639 [Gigaspora margarita]|uniref:Uncharacterized protein n=1 Tax=Gigaspora margarita TaxID=4874 RepID=A0A8H4AL65_GIGMA|nr:hypothetical protein F8M41_018639 [Gigaspora margarita]